MLRFLGLIEIPAGVSKNNTDTATQFVIPSTVKAIRFRQSATGLYVLVTKDKTTPSSFAATAATGFPVMDPSNFPPGMLGVPPLRLVDGGDANVLAVFNSTGGPLTMQVWSCLPSSVG